MPNKRFLELAKRLGNEELPKERTKKEIEKEIPKQSKKIDGFYDLVKENTYALAVDKIRNKTRINNPEFAKDSGSKIYRPLTFKETIEAKVNDYNSGKTDEERKRLFETWIDSCTGVCYKVGTTKFKIIPVCKELILIDKDFNESYLRENYDSLNGIELDSSDGKYNELLTKSEILNHPAWLEAVENDKALLRECRDIVLNLKPDAEKLMGFYARQNTNDDELRVLYVCNLVYGSGAYARSGLGNLGRLLSVAHRKNF